MNRFFDDLGERLSVAAAQRGAPIEAPGLDPAVAQELLELARVAAHTQERRFAPLASFVTGVAVERMRQAGGPSSPESIAELIREIRTDLEAQTNHSELV
ncbi:MAG TPA: DUF6457 domain-containing protein [Candidatus Dormibacteraeota bacterium]